MDYPDGKIFPCDICGQDFNCETILEMHIIEHSDQNKSQCSSVPNAANIFQEKIV